MSENFTLTPWQKKQATLLYYFSSLPYLQGLKQKVFDLAGFSEGVLGKSREQERDQFLQDVKWGPRNTTENWANNGWQFLEEFKRSIMRDIVDRSAQIYHVTGAYQFARGISEFSMAWTTPEEQNAFDKKFEAIYRYAGNIDRTMDKRRGENAWTDFEFVMAWREHEHLFSELPVYRVSGGVNAYSGELPPKTGVYVAVDDPNATLQFAWNGSPYGKLLDATTFNALGLAALEFVGREKLWLDKAAMLDFVKQNLSSAELQSDAFFQDAQTEELAPSLVARNADDSRPSRWLYLEQIQGQFEKPEKQCAQVRAMHKRFEAGDVCTEEGWYLTPAQAGSRRHMAVGDVFPALASEYGKTIWQREGA